jgi:hypothetical protein
MGYMEQGPKERSWIDFRWTAVNPMIFFWLRQLTYRNQVDA